VYGEERIKMFKFKIIKSKKPFKPDIGEILYGEDYFEEFTKDDLKEKDILPLCYMNAINPWKVLQIFSVDPYPFQSQVSYHCPLLNQEYYWAVPSYILTNDLAQYLKGTRHAQLFQNDWDYLREIGREHYKKDSSGNADLHRDHLMFLSRATDLLLGSGFTEGTLPSDGSGEIKEAKINLNNGDFIVANLWFWFNK